MTERRSPQKSSLTVAVETVNTSTISSYSRVLEGSTTSLRKSASTVSPAERRFAFDTACQCVEEALQTRGPDLVHARYFRLDGFRLLREALQTDALDDSSCQASISTSGASVEEDTADSSYLYDQHLRDTASSETYKKRLGIWKKIKRRLSTESPGRQGPPETVQIPACDQTSLSPMAAGSRQHGLREERNYSFVSINVEKTLALLISAAPNRGEVQHWVWLLRAYMDKCSLDSIQVILGYLAKVAKHIAPEEEWLRLLVLELTPVLATMRENDLPTSSQAVVRTVADQAMQVAEAAILNFRAHRSSRLENVSLLASALRLQILVAKCASAADCTDMGGLFEELLTKAAHQRYRSLVQKHSTDAGVGAPTAGPAGSKDAAKRMVASMAAVCDCLVQDISDDDECYQAAFPAECRVTLPAISCRVYCTCLRVQLSHLLRQTPDADRQFFALFRAVHQLEQATLRWAPSTLGSERSLCTSEGRLLFLPHIEAWIRGVRAKLMQWSMRLLKEEVWQPAAAGSQAGLRCSPSLVELFRALCAVVEDNAAFCSAHPSYAAVIERMLNKVVLVHVAGLERLCQGEMPAKAGQRLSGQLRSLGSRGSEEPRRPFQPSPTLCMLLNDLREIRSKQADLGNALRCSLDADLWGRSTDGGLREKMRLGDRFKLCQVEIERRYAAVLHHCVKRMMEGFTPLLTQLLASPSADESNLIHCLEPLTGYLDGLLAQLAPLLDTRVLSRVARELWNALAGALHEDLLDCQDGRDSSNVQHSLGNVGPRIQHVDAILKHLSDHIVEHKLTGLSQEHEPEKVTKLRKMLALFMREDEGKSIESL